MIVASGCAGATAPPAPPPAPIKDSGPGLTTLPPLGVIGSRPTSDNGQQLEVTLNEVRVRGQLMSVIWTAKNVSQSGSWQVGGFFSDGRTQPPAPNAPPQSDSDSSGSTDGVYVIDSANSKRYLPARDPDGNCVCTINGNSLFLTAGQSTTFQATFKAPPDNITSVDVNIPRIGVFIGVAISR
jgi:hypothetical protein